MTDAVWPNAAVNQNHYERDWQRHAEYILDKHHCHPLYDRQPLRQRQSAPSPRHPATAHQHQHQYPDQYGALPYPPPATSSTTLGNQARQPASRPLARAVGRCRVTYPHVPPPPPQSTTPVRSQHPRPNKSHSPGAVSGHDMSGHDISGHESSISRQPAIPKRQPTPAPPPEPVPEPETVSLLNPTGRFAEKVAAIQRIHQLDESIPQEHLPTRRPARRMLGGVIPWLKLIPRCRQCQQPWPCPPLRTNLTRRYGPDNLTAKIHALSTKKLRTQANKRSPTAIRHRGWTPRTWYGKPKPE